MTKLSALSVEELLAEVNRRRKALPKLLKQKAKIQEKLTAIEEEIQALDSDAVKSGKVGSIRRARQAQWAKSVQAPTAARNKRARNNISLIDAVLRVLPSGSVRNAFWPASGGGRNATSCLPTSTLRGG